MTNKDTIKEEWNKLEHNLLSNHTKDSIADFWLQILDREMLALKEEVKGMKKCEFESDGFEHSCFNMCEGMVQNCKKCHKDLCSNENCPNGKGDKGYNEVYNQAIDDITNLKSLN